MEDYVWTVEYTDSEFENRSIKSVFKTKEAALTRQKKVAEEWIKEYDYELTEALKEIAICKKRLLG